MKHIAILGNGSWGAALAFLAAQRETEVILWSRDAAQAREVNERRTNHKYLPDIVLPPGISATTEIGEAIAGADLVIMAVPSQSMREVVTKTAAAGIGSQTVLLSCTKGIEKSTGCRMSEILTDFFPGHPVAVLSGPNHAEEVVRGLAAAAVIGCANENVAIQLQQIFTLPWFRTYTHDDVAGIEWGGAAKNIFAIAAGVAEGLGLGDNARAALVTRGLAEMIRLGVALGGRPETFQGLSGVGDLIATCYSHHSRNNRVGRLLGKGQTLEEISTSSHMVAEGVPNTESIYLSCRKHGVRSPIIDQVYAILYEGKACACALSELLSRDPRAESEARKAPARQEPQREI